MKGTVKFYNESKGYGFISAEDGSEIFVHSSALGGAVIKEGDVVTYDVGEGRKGPAAVNVKVGGAEEAPAEPAQAEESSDDSNAESSESSDDSSSEESKDDDSEMPKAA